MIRDAQSSLDRHKHCRYSHQYLGGPIKNTLQPLCGAAFRTTHSFAFARCLIQPFSSIGLFISSGFLYLDTTCRCYALTVPAIRCQHTVKSYLGGPDSLVRGLGTNAASLAIKSNGGRPPRSNTTCVVPSRSGRAGTLSSGHI